MYDDDGLKQFFGRVLGVPELHRYQDAKGAVNVTFMRDDDRLEWHFDQHELVVSFQLQAPSSGGVLEVVPDMRPAASAAMPGIERLLAGAREHVVNVHAREGDAVIVRGGASLHRVTPVCGPRSRVVALFCYDRFPGVTGSNVQRTKRYG